MNSFHIMLEHSRPLNTNLTPKMGVVIMCL